MPPIYLSNCFWLFLVARIGIRSFTLALNKDSLKLLATNKRCCVRACVRCVDMRACSGAWVSACTWGMRMRNAYVRATSVRKHLDVYVCVRKLVSNSILTSDEGLIS